MFNWLKYLWRKLFPQRHEIFMGIDAGYVDNSIIIIRWDKKTHTMTVLSDFYNKKGCLLKLDKQVRELCKKFPSAAPNIRKGAFFKKAPKVRLW